MTGIAAAQQVLAAGGLVILPTDTVYGLVCLASDEDAVGRIHGLKGRAPGTPIAVLGADVDALVACVPELRGPSEAAMHALLPGALTLVLPNPAGRLPWLGGARPDTIGVRVPVLPDRVRQLVASAGVLAATSANPSGGADPRRLDEVDHGLRAAADAALDGGTLPGTPSTVVDLTGDTPLVLREGAVDSTLVLQRVRAGVGR